MMERISCGRLATSTLAMSPVGSCVGRPMAVNSKGCSWPKPMFHKSGMLVVMWRRLRDSKPVPSRTEATRMTMKHLELVRKETAEILGRVSSYMDRSTVHRRMLPAAIHRRGSTWYDFGGGLSCTGAGFLMNRVLQLRWLMKSSFVARHMSLV